MPPLSAPVLAGGVAAAVLVGLAGGSLSRALDPAEPVVVEVEPSAAPSQTAEPSEPAAGPVPARQGDSSGLTVTVVDQPTASPSSPTPTPTSPASSDPAEGAATAAEPAAEPSPEPEDTVVSPSPSTSPTTSPSPTATEEPTVERTAVSAGRR